MRNTFVLLNNIIMKTSIVISGQINGNHRLRNAILTHEAEERKTMFNGYEITFPTKKAAKSALWSAFKYMKADEPGITNRLGGLRYNKFGSLYYDASKAEIE